MIRENDLEKVQEIFPNENIGAFTVSNSSLQMVIVQFTALKFLDISNSEDKEGKPFKLVELSPQGRSYLLNVSAVRRGQLAKAANSSPDADGEEE